MIDISNAKKWCVLCPSFLEFDFKLSFPFPLSMACCLPESPGTALGLIGAGGADWALETFRGKSATGTLKVQIHN